MYFVNYVLCSIIFYVSFSFLFFSASRSFRSASFFARPTNFKISSKMITGKLNKNTNNQSMASWGLILKTAAMVGTYKMKKCITNEAAMATNNQGLTHGGIVKREPSSLTAFKALNISMVTKTDNDNVDA